MTEKRLSHNTNARNHLNTICGWAWNGAEWGHFDGNKNLSKVPEIIHIRHVPRLKQSISRKFRRSGSEPELVFLRGSWCNGQCSAMDRNCLRPKQSICIKSYGIGSEPEVVIFCFSRCNGHCSSMDSNCLRRVVYHSCLILE